MRQLSPVVTTVFALARFDNKGDAYTTIHTATLSFEYEGQKYEGIPSQGLNVTVMAGSSTRKQMIFNVPLVMNQISDGLEKAVIRISHTHGEVYRVRPYCTKKLKRKAARF